MTVGVHPLVSQWGRFSLYSFFIDAPEPAIVDTGIASSPAEGMAPALEALGRRIEDVRWILLTHGHIDHVGGAHALWELTGRRARVVIHEADAHHLDPGEWTPVLVRDGDSLPLGGGVEVAVHSIPGHTAGSVAYVVDRAAFVGDAVQIHGAASGFPGYGDPDAYRASLTHLLTEVGPERMYLGHPYRGADGVAHGVELDRAQARQALQESIDLEARIRKVAVRHGQRPDESIYSPFAPVADELGYTGDPTLEPSPFFTTLHGYAQLNRSHP